MEPGFNARERVLQARVLQAVSILMEFVGSGSLLASAMTCEGKRFIAFGDLQTISDMVKSQQHEAITGNIQAANSNQRSLPH